MTTMTKPAIKHGDRVKVCPAGVRGRPEYANCDATVGLPVYLFGVEHPNLRYIRLDGYDHDVMAHVTELVSVEGN